MILSAQGFGQKTASCLRVLLGRQQTVEGGARKIPVLQRRRRDRSADGRSGAGVSGQSRNPKGPACEGDELAAAKRQIADEGRIVLRITPDEYFLGAGLAARAAGSTG